MRHFLMATTAGCALATAASAGGMAEPVMEPEVVVEEAATNTSGGWLVPVLLLVLIAAAVASTNDGGSSSPPPAVSDLRLKTDVRAIGMTPQGLPLYRFRYAGLPGTYEGVMAQDVARIRPDAVVRMPYGYMAVDYAKLGLRMKTVH